MARPKRIGARKAAPTPAEPVSAIPNHISSSKTQRSSTTSDDSDGLAMNKPDAPRTRNSPYRMSGAVPVEDMLKDGKRPRAVRGQQRRDLNRAARDDEASKRAIDALRKRMEEEEAKKKLSKQDSQRQQSRVPTKPSGPAEPAPPVTLQVQRSNAEPECEEEPAPYNAPPSAWKRTSAVPMSTRKPLSTPRAEASMMTLANFKRRSRAPSILGIGNDDETASISSAGSFGDLVPDDESTPLPRMRTQPGKQARTTSTPNSDNFESPVSSSRKRKREAADILAPDSQPSPSVPSPQASSAKVIDVPSDVDLSSEDSLPQLPTEQRKDVSRTPSSTMAPPESSSPTKHNFKGAEKRDSAQTEMVRMDPSPDRGVAKRWKRGRAAKTGPDVINTAALQDMLPKRRQRAAKDQITVWSSDGVAGEGDDDELSFAPTKKRAKAGRTRPALGTTRTPNKNIRAVKKSANQSTKHVTPLGSGKVSRTYSRRQSGQENSVEISDDENSASGSDANDAGRYDVGEAKRKSPIKQSQTLKAMARKFAEVDTWQMDFEEITGSSDTLKNAR